MPHTSNNKHLISVIIPVYNAEKYLDRCLDSILAQTYSNFELILVDDGSTDSSLSICKRYESKDSRIKVLTGPNGGSSVARNKGLDIAKGEYIIHIDADDWTEPQMFELMLNKAVSEDADIVACNICSDDGNGNATPQCFSYLKETKHNLYGVHAYQCSVWNKLVKHSLYYENSIRFIPGITMWEDVVVTTRLRYYSRRTLVVPDILYHYFNAPRDSMCTVAKDKYPESQISVIKYLDSYFGDKVKYDDNLKRALANLKLLSKWDILDKKTLGGAKEWKTMFKESHKYIWKSQFAFTRKIIMTAASLMNPKLFEFVYDRLRFLKK